MSKVYFKAVSNYSETEVINDAVTRLLDKVVEEENVKLNDFIPLKVHFGEKGNTTFIHPKNFQGIYDFLDKKNIDSSYIETNVLYRGERMFSESHKKLAVEHGFTKYPIIIADGDHGEAYEEIEINKKHFKSCKIGRAFTEYDQFLIVSHFKGHVMAGFGGAIKQLAMGCASRGGKLAQHDDSKIRVRSEKCVKCNKCVKECPVDAIKLTPTAVIDENVCVGCASCMAACKFGAIGNSWSIGDDTFIERITEYAYAASLNKNNIYLTYVFNITKFCDCEGHAMELIADDLGVLVSTDPVALDKACYDLLNEKNNRTVFEQGLRAIEYGNELDMGSENYEIIEIG